MPQLKGRSGDSLASNDILKPSGAPGVDLHGQESTVEGNPQDPQPQQRGEGDSSSKKAPRQTDQTPKDPLEEED